MILTYIQHRVGGTMRDEEIKKEIEKLTTRYKHNKLTPKDKDNLEQAESILNIVAKESKIKLDPTLINSPAEMEKILDRCVYHIKGSKHLGSITETKELVEVFGPYIIVGLGILTNNIEIASLALIHQLYMKQTK